MSDSSIFDKSGESLTSRLFKKTGGAVSKPASMSGSDSRTLLKYWNGMRDGVELPKRSAIDPRAITGMLSKTFILEQIAPGLARFRVAGSHLSDLMGMDVRGMPLSAMLLPAARDELASSLEELFAHPGILRAALVSPGGLGRAELEAELLILPLRDDQGRTTRAIGCFVAHGQITKAPRRFSFRSLRVDPVSVVKAPVREATSETTMPVVEAVRTRGKMDQTGELRFAPPKPGQPDYLRLVVMD